MSMKLEIGYNHDFEVRREEYRCGLDINITILFLSDLHFNAFSRPMAERLIETINKLKPDMILFGGDYVDTKAGLQNFDYLLKAIGHRENVFVIAGNHDKFFGIDKIGKVMEANGLVWIDKQSAALEIDGVRVTIDTAGSRSVTDPNVFSILLLHEPVDVAANQYNLVFAGHLHGCQFVLWQNENGLYPGRLFYEWNKLKAKSGNSTYLISKGLGDTLPVRYNCKRDIIFVTVQQ